MSAQRTPTLANAADRLIALKVAREAEDNDLPTRAEAIRACVRSAEIAGELLAVLREMNRSGVLDSGMSVTLARQARAAIAEAEGR